MGREPGHRGVMGSKVWNRGHGAAREVEVLQRRWKKNKEKKEEKNAKMKRAGRGMKQGRRDEESKERQGQDAAH